MTGTLADLSFLRPWLLWLLPVPPLLLLRRAPAVAMLRAPLRWGAGTADSRVGSLAWFGSRWLCAAAAALLLLAAAGPVHRTPVEASPSAGAAVMAVLDVSPSMTGGTPAPLSVAQASLQELLQRRRDVRLGLVTFAGSALTRLPPTTDPELVERALVTAPAGIRDDGTALGTAVGLAVERLAAVEARERLVVILSDGMHNAGAVDPVTAAGLARVDGTRVHALLLRGAPDAGRALLEEVVRAGGGALFTSPADADTLLARLEEVAPLPGPTPGFTETPAWSGPLGAALALLAAALLLHLVRPGRWRWWPPAGPAGAGGVALAAAALALSRGPAGPDPGPLPDAATIRVAVDVSRSMAVRGGGGRRLDRGRDALRELLARVPGARVELAVFSGTAHTLLPPTRDLPVVLRYLEALEPGLMSRTGTAREALIGWLARPATADGPGGDRAAVVLTDGEWHDDDGPLPPGLPPAHVLWTGRPERGAVPGVTGAVSTARRTGPDRLARETGGRVVAVDDGPALAGLAQELAPARWAAGGAGSGSGASGAAGLPSHAPSSGGRRSAPRPPLTAVVSALLLSLSLWLRGGRP